MIINKLHDLEVVKNALDNYVSNGEKMISSIKTLKTPEIIIEDVEKNIIRGKELLIEVENEFKIALNEKVKENIAKQKKLLQL